MKPSNSLKTLTSMFMLGEMMSEPHEKRKPKKTTEKIYLQSLKDKAELDELARASRTVIREKGDKDA